ncbi:MAG TPA: alpha/beta hydrolase [Pseudomonadales bacterium]|nr:alpha/beta hydrolase [Pseudomonadales bacterium]
MKFHHFGDPDGAPLVFFHGMPSSGDEAELLHEAAKQQGVHVLAPDRPGFGATAFDPDRTLMSTARQVAEALRQMGYARYAVAGCSGGGPYTFALAAVAPEAVHFAAPIAGIYPFQGWRALTGMHWNNRVVFYLAQKRPRWIRLLFNITLTRLRQDENKAYFDSLKLLPPEDAAYFSQPAVATIMQRALRNSMQQGNEGAILETQLFARQWDIDSQLICCPLIAWHGERDTAVPVRLAQAYFDATAANRSAVYQLIRLPTAHISTLAEVIESNTFWQGVKTA